MADALSKKSMKSLVHIAQQKREAVKELCRLFSQRLSLEVPETQPMIAQFWVRSNMIEEIKVVQDSDPVLVKLKKKVQVGQDDKFSVHQGILKLNNRICMPDVNNLKQKILHEVHYAPYNVDTRATKMYHDVKAIYWWNRLKKDIAEFVAFCLSCL